MSGFLTEELFEGNADFREYVHKYCRYYKLKVADALQHAIVREVAKQYKEREYEQCELKM